MKQAKPMQKTINLCKSCNCMTKTLADGSCGKCRDINWLKPHHYEKDGEVCFCGLQLDNPMHIKTKPPVRKSRTTEDMKTREWEEEFKEEFYRKEKDYGYEYPIKAIRYDDWEIDVRKMRKDEMTDDGITYYCEKNGTIYHEGEEDFKLLSKINL